MSNINRHDYLRTMATSENQDVVNAKTAGDGIDDDDIISSTDADTSSWESEPNTARSSRQYYPVKGRESTTVVADCGDPEHLTNGVSAEENPITLGDTGLLSSQYLKNTLGVENPAIQDNQANGMQGSHNGWEGDKPQTDGRLSFDGVKERDGTTSESSVEIDDLGDEDVLELNLTKEPKGALPGRGFPGVLPHPQFGFPPPLFAFGASPFDSLMTGLLSSDGDGFENDADVSSQSEEEEERHPRERDSTVSPELDGGSQQERWDHLFTILEQQHIQQLTLQREHHDRQVDMLQMQLARLTEEHEGLITKQHQYPLGGGTMTPKREATTTGQGDHEKLVRITTNGQEGPRGKHRRTTSPGFISVSSQEETDSDSDRTLEGSLEEACETLMTTWSDVVEQKQAEMEKDKTPDKKESMRVQSDGIGDIPPGQQMHDNGVDDVSPHDNRLIALQNHFAQQQQTLQEQYASQVVNMQHQWLSLQKQQQEQQEIIRHLLARQQDRISQTQRDIRGVTQGGGAQDSDDTDQKGDSDRLTPSSDDASTTYSDFTYWKQAEQDTYKALPDMSTDDVSSEQRSPLLETNKCQRSPHKKASPHRSPIGQRSPDLHRQGIAQRSDQRSPRLSGQSSLPGQAIDEDGDLREDANLLSRLNLREKHARHIADLKAYYDSEIQELQAKLTEATSLKDLSPYKTLKRTNQRLQSNCVKLENSLKSANGRIEDLEQMVKAVETRLAEPQDSTNSSVTSLHQKVNDLKHLCRHKELDIQTLEKKNRELQVSLDQAYQLQDAQAMDEQRDPKILKRVLAEYKALAEKHEVTRDMLQATETQLYESKAKITDLTRVVSSLELEVRRIDLESSVLKRQSLPESLSGTTLRSENTATRSLYDSNQNKAQSQASAEYTNDHSIHKASGDAPSVGRSVEDRKLLKSSFNMFTGKELISSESESDSLQIATDSENSTRLDDDRAAPNRPSNLEVPFDLDEERPLSPMMKAAHQFDVWKVEESMNAGSGSLETGLNGKLENGGHWMSPRDNNRSGNNSRQYSCDKMPSPRWGFDGDPLTSDASIHIWPSPETGKKRSPLSGSSKTSTALAQSSPKQHARKSLAKAIKPQDHDIFPVKGHKDSPGNSKGSSQKSRSRQSVGMALSPGRTRKRRESPRKQLFTVERKSDDKLLLKGGILPLPADGEDAAGSVLARVRAGDVQTRADWEGPTKVSSSPRNTRNLKNQAETGYDIIQRINEHQKKLDNLIMEKRQLETALSHVPISGRISHRSRKEEEFLEQRLEQVAQQLGSVRMLLRKYNALKSSI